jgi:Glyoxalase-like domain
MPCICVSKQPAGDGWVVLCDPDGKGPNLSFQARETRRPQRSWIRDLYTDKQEREVNRLLQLGARDAISGGIALVLTFVVLEDPRQRSLRGAASMNAIAYYRSWNYRGAL